MININVTKGQVFKYAFLPQVLPRLQGLIFSGFSNLAYFIALVYRATNILPDNHLYLKTSSVGKYSIRNVLSEAAKHVRFDLKHIDQVIIFFALIAGLFILIAQFLLLATSIFVGSASAATEGLPIGIGEFFVTPDPTEDLALRMLDSVFGVPEIFGSRELNAENGYDPAFHEALHGLFQIYSFGLLVIAAIILAYFIFAILAETAQTGTPFGKRYNHVWAPIRLVAGIGLLVPITLGLNSSQWITLYAAKLGSGFATQGWTLFNTKITETYLERDTLVSEVNVPDLKDIAAFMMLARACKYAYADQSQIDNINMYVISNKGGGQSLYTGNYFNANSVGGTSDIHIRFGEKNEEHYTDDIGNVRSHCGDIILQNTENIGDEYEALVRAYNDTDADTEERAAASQALQDSYTAGVIMNIQYFRLIFNMWTSNYADTMETSVTRFMDHRLNNVAVANDPPSEIKKQMIDKAVEDIERGIPFAISKAKEKLAGKDDLGLEKYGWGGASLWYNQIANVNGSMTSAILNKPQIKLYPLPMEITCEENQQENDETDLSACYDPNLSNEKKVQYLGNLDENIAKALSDLFDFWYKDPEDLTGNAFLDTINAILGLDGLFDMCKNADIHPLAQLSSLGKGLIEAAVRNLGLSLGSGAAGILAGYFGPTLDAASGFFGTVASIGILIGFILFYIVPFLPFLYFMFAVGGWVKGIFEAMVGVPLWALAHLRIDGEGLPGDAAINGYFLIFEIFIRPILIIFGLIASVLVFGAMVRVLNDIFTIAVSNLSGFSGVEAAEGAEAGKTCTSTGLNTSDPGSIEWLRGPVDEFFFTVVYAIIVYMTGMSCFKLIDQIPNNILRWMGQGVQTFNDQAGEPADGLISKMAIGGSMLTQQMSMVGNLKDTAKGLGNAAADAVTPPKPPT